MNKLPTQQPKPQTTLQTAHPLALTGAPTLAMPFLKWLLKIPTLSRMYDRWLADNSQDAHAFLSFMQNELAADIQFLGALDAIPPTGRVIFIANHPLGAIEGILLMNKLLTLRPDCKAITNHLLLRFPEFQSVFLGVDILNKNRDNKQALLNIHQHVENGGALLVFPAGTVGHLNLKTREIIDAKWQHTAAKLAIQYDATCIPIHIKGRNDYRFYLSAYIHPLLRTMLLPRAMLAAKKRPITFTVGTGFTLSDNYITNKQIATDYLRVRCELLGEEQSITPTKGEPLATVSAPSSVDFLAPYLLVAHDNLSVYACGYDALGRLKNYLASQREMTFRQAGEGSGKSLDIDAFDPTYQHIIAWDHDKHRLVGAYRACLVAKGLDQPTQLYSRSLFHYDDAFVQAFSGAIEVGRSFICAPYQKNPKALDMLWKGLGRFMLKHPNCHTFIGCVSISSSYSRLTRELLYKTLLGSYQVNDVTQFAISPQTPLVENYPHISGKLVNQLSSVRAVNRLLGHSALDIRVPTLIKHYLNLNGQFIDFSVNKHFNDSLDGLIIVDLRRAPQRYLQRYMGSQGAANFYERWQA